MGELELSRLKEKFQLTNEQDILWVITAFSDPESLIADWLQLLIVDPHALSRATELPCEIELHNMGYSPLDTGCFSLDVEELREDPEGFFEVLGVSSVAELNDMLQTRWISERLTLLLGGIYAAAQHRLVTVIDSILKVISAQKNKHINNNEIYQRALNLALIALFTKPNLADGLENNRDFLIQNNILTHAEITQKIQQINARANDQKTKELVAYLLSLGANPYSTINIAIGFAANEKCENAYMVATEVGKEGWFTEMNRKNVDIAHQLTFLYSSPSFANKEWPMYKVFGIMGLPDKIMSYLFPYPNQYFKETVKNMLDKSLRIIYFKQNIFPRIMDESSNLEDSSNHKLAKSKP